MAQRLRQPKLDLALRIKFANSKLWFHSGVRDAESSASGKAQVLARWVLSRDSTVGRNRIQPRQLSRLRLRDRVSNYSPSLCRKPLYGTCAAHGHMGSNCPIPHIRPKATSGRPLLALGGARSPSSQPRLILPKWDGLVRPNCPALAVRPKPLTAALVRHTEFARRAATFSVMATPHLAPHLPTSGV